MSPTPLRILLLAVAEVLAVGAGVAMFLRTGEAHWTILGALLSGMMTLVFLWPELRQMRLEQDRA